MAPVTTDAKPKTADGGKAVADPLSAEELRKMDAYFRALNYLTVGQIYLLDNPVMKEPLKREHIKPRLLGHWGTSPGLNMLCVHLNRVIKRDDLNMIYINIVNLMKLQSPSEHPHGLPDGEFDALFTKDKPIIFAFHGYPWLIHRLTYRRTNHKNLHVHGYKEEGTTTTPFDMLVLNDMDRFHLVEAVIDQLPQLGARAGLFLSGGRGKADRAQALHSGARRRHAGDRGLALVLAGRRRGGSLRSPYLNRGRQRVKG